MTTDANTIFQKVNACRIAALKSGSPTHEVLGSMCAEIKNKAIAAGVDRVNIPDDVSVDALRKMAKQRKDSAQAYADVGALDRSKAELAEVGVIESFLPDGMSEGKVTEIVSAAIGELQSSGRAVNLGTVMKIVAPQVKGQFDGKALADIVNRILSEK